MSRLAEKYCIPSETVDKMVKDGVISCSWPMRDGIYDMYLKLKGKMKYAEIVREISQEKRVSESTVQKSIQKLSKI